MVNKILIENFKSIKKMEMELRSINVLIGANGAGKSNFVNFFRLLYNLYNQNLQNYIADQAGAENILYLGLKHSDFLQSRLEFDNTNAYYFRLKPNQQSDLYFEREGDQFNREKGNYRSNKPLSWDNDLIGSGYAESKLIEKSQGRYINRRLVYVNNYMKSFKVFHFHDTSSTAKVKQTGNINDNEYLREDAGNLAAFLFLLQEKYPKSLKKIEMQINSVAPFFEGFDLKADRKREDQIRLEWKESGSDMYLNASHLSDGTLRFICLSALLLQPNPPKTIIIDEPELGLHPFAINKLAGLIKKSAGGSQIIISTQSTELLNNFEPDDIITVDRKNQESIFTRQNNISLQYWLEEYSIGDLWNKNVIGGRP